MANTPVRQYIGARYVPLFADPAEWDNKRTYEPLTIVIHNGNSYTSRQYVPIGIDINNNEYWALTGNYDAQVEQYRHEVAQYKHELDQCNANLNVKLETVAHDDTLIGAGTTKDPLKVSDNISDNINAKLETVAHDDTLIGAGTTKDPLKVSDNIKTTIQQYKSRLAKNYVLLGDSWTQVHHQTLYKTLKQLNPNSKWYNYGVDGNVIQQLPQQINTAKQDATLDPAEITDVIIVMGTNNVFWQNLSGYTDITEQAAAEAFQAVKNYFPNANIMYFPNNSKTLNDGRNKLYRNIINGAIKANINVHNESLYWLAGHLGYYNGNDQEGVQHLSDNGYTKFAYFIHNIINKSNPFPNGAWIVTNFFTDYTNPTAADKIDDNTIKIVNVRTKPITTIGYMTNVSLVITYYADEKINLNLNGDIHITVDNINTYTTGNYITCENWNKRIAPHTLPYIFLGENYITYPQLDKISGMDSTFLTGFASTETTESTLKNTYIKLPQLTKNSYQLHLKINNAPTSITNFAL